MDQALLRAVNGLRSPALDPTVKFLTTWGFYFFPLALLAALFVHGRRIAPSVRDGLLAWFLALTVAEDILKPIIGRARPTAYASVRATLRVLGRVPPASSYGFPSGTAAACGAGAAWIWIRFGPRYGVPASLLALLISATRLYVGVHWPTDILAGLALGAAMAYGVDRFARWAEPGSVTRGASPAATQPPAATPETPANPPADAK